MGQHIMAIMSFLDMLNAVGSAPAMAFIPLVLQVPLQNLCVPLTALFAFFYLHTRFLQVHYAGIVLTLLSCIAGVVVELQGPAAIVCDGLDAAQTCVENNANACDQGTVWAIGNGTQNCVAGLPPYTDAKGNILYVALG